MSFSASAKHSHGNFVDESGEVKPLLPTPVDTLKPIHAALILSSGLLVMFSVPSMTFSLYKIRLQETMQYTDGEIQDIVSFGLIGGMCLGFVPGFIYDLFGYSVTLATGGLTALVGTGSWYFLLRDGGKTGEPGWFSLALGMGILCLGVRTMYFAGMGCALNSLPRCYASSASALMAIMVSVGYILMPLMWRKGFLSSDESTIPVANFYAALGAIYLFATVVGLAMSGFIPKPAGQGAAAAESQEPIGERLARLKNPHATTLMAFHVFSMAFIYTFMTSATASAHRHAGISPADGSKIIMHMGMVGMAGRFAFGFGADFHQKRCGLAGPYMMYLIATLCSVLAYSVLLFGFDNDGAKTTGKPVWSGDVVLPVGYFAVELRLGVPEACLLNAFAFGGFFALFPATTRLTFGAKDFGFFLGLQFVLVGSLNYIFGQFGATYQYGAEFWRVCLYCAMLSVLMFLAMIRKCWNRIE